MASAELVYFFHSGIPYRTKCYNIYFQVPQSNSGHRLILNLKAIGNPAVCIPQRLPDSGRFSSRGQVLTDLVKQYLQEILLQTLTSIACFNPPH